MAQPRLTVCPLTGRVGMWTAVREQRPQPRPQRLLLEPEPPTCPFDDPDPRLLPFEAKVDGVRWYAMRNIYPPIDGETGTADLAYAEDHDPTLIHDHPMLAARWASMLAVQQQLAVRRPDRWTMLSAATGRSAGASQHHPHGHALTPAVVPAATIAQQGRWHDPGVSEVLLADSATVATGSGARLIAAPVPLGPLDLWVVPERAQRLVEADPRALGGLIAAWVRGVHGLLRADDQLPTDLDPRLSPFDAKIVLHSELPDGSGRWWGELTVTDRHAPGVAAVPLVDLRYTPEVQAQRFAAHVGQVPS